MRHRAHNSDELTSSMTRTGPLAHIMSRLVASPIKRMGSATVIVARHQDDISVAHFEYALRKCGLGRP